MKTSKLAATVALGLALAAGQAFAGSMDNVMSMDKNKDGMISKSEAMAMFEQKLDAMMKAKGIKQFTPKDVQALIDEIAKTYGTSN